MTYRELLELYKTGELELEQRKKVEKDIERQEAISDYLYRGYRYKIYRDGQPFNQTCVSQNGADYFSGGMCADFICTILPSNDCIMFLL